MKAYVLFLPIQGQRTEGSIILRHLQTQAPGPQASEPLTGKDKKVLPASPEVPWLQCTEPKPAGTVLSGKPD